ncbi:MAG: hypothetical protein M1142_00825 [Patescibacteria group bacterium]|nr:hypothetical protein [Patescibacteria group bacterium]
MKIVKLKKSLYMYGSRCRKGYSFQAGVSLIEIVVIIVAVSFLSMIVSSMPLSISSIASSKHASIAKDVAERQLDYLRRQTYPLLANGTTVFSDASLGALSGASAFYDVQGCPAEICQNGEKAKQVSVTINWNEAGNNKTVNLTTLVGQGGVGQ